jgi:MoaA/NifB/PqqE/SkfB family radical SAM enzyme/Flp pilus assembly protein TadD
MNKEINLTKIGKNFLDQKDYRQAEEVFKEIARSNPKDSQAYRELGKICCIQQKYPEAIEKLEMAIKLNENDVCAHFLLAKAYSQQGIQEEAIGEFEKTLELNTKEETYLSTVDEQSYFELGSIYYKQQKYELAVTKLEKAIQLTSDYIFAHLLLAKSYKAMEKYSESINEFKKVLEYGYRDENIHKELADMYKILNNFELAVAELKKAMENGYDMKLFQSDLNSLYHKQIRLIQYYNSKGSYSKALQEIDSVYRLTYPEDGNLQNIILNEKEIAQKKVVLCSKIRSLTFTLTNRCNLRCLMCNTRKKPWDLPSKTKKEIIKILPYLERIMWQGGEAFMYEDFEELLDEASKFSIRQVLATNGLLINERIAKKLVQYNVELTFSIDGTTKDVYERIRIGSNFDKVLKNLNLINKLKEKLNPNMKTRLNVLIMRTNYHQIEDFLDFAKQYKFSTLFFNAAGCDFKDFKENIFYYNFEPDIMAFINKIRDRISEKADRLNISLENWLPSESFLMQKRVQDMQQGVSLDKHRFTINGENAENCDANTELFCHSPWQRLYIDCGGEVRPDCLCLTHNIVGNISENTLEEIWNGNRMKEYREKIISKSYQDFCNPDCVLGRIPKRNLKYI